jgi:tight adherence protein B
MVSARHHTRLLDSPRRLVLATFAGGIAFMITRWPMALPLGALSILSVQGLTGGADRPAIERLEAIAAWTEMLRDTMAGASGLTQALVATGSTAPKAIRPQISQLVAGIEAGVPLEVALTDFAEALEDPSADLIVAALIMANRDRAQRLGELLGGLATSCRSEVTMRLGVEASRTSARSAVRMITAFSLGLFVLMAIFAKSYLEPYRTANGQLMLGVVGVIFGFGLWLMSAMVRPRPLPRLTLTLSRSNS